LVGAAGVFVAGELAVPEPVVDGVDAVDVPGVLLALLVSPDLCEKANTPTIKANIRRPPIIQPV
jgi:hypothetical protein